MKRSLALIAACAAVPLAVAYTAAQAAAPTSQQALGKRLYLRCIACHAITPQAAPKIGPHLSRVVGRRAGSLPGFRYSAAMRGSNVVWNEATLDRWLQRPQAVVPGTTMAFAGMTRPEERQALIAYLKKPVP